MSDRTKKKARVDIYAEVTALVVESLERGVVPWRRPWRDRVAARFATDGRPRNAVSGKAYRGVNAWALPMIGEAKGFTDPRWVSFKQAQELGGRVRKGEKAARVTFWKFFDKVDDAGDVESRIPMLRHYSVFNVEQCEGLLTPSEPCVTDEPAPIDERCEAVIAGMPFRPEILRTGSAAFYEPARDRVTMPDARSFRSLDSFYHVMFHELAHATGHESRLNRRDETGAAFAAFGSPVYAREELVAELASAMVGRSIGVDPDVDTTAAYCESWLRALKNDPKLLVQASAKAQRAADWILGETWGDEPTRDVVREEPVRGLVVSAPIVEALPDPVVVPDPAPVVDEPVVPVVDEPAPAYLVQVGSAGWATAGALDELWRLASSGWPVQVKAQASRFSAPVVVPDEPAKPTRARAPRKATGEPCKACGARSGHYTGCDRNRWRMPALTSPRAGTAASVRLEGSIRKRLAAIKVDPRTGYIHHADGGVIPA
jgi:antirestriction protein ArdC